MQFSEVENAHYTRQCKRYTHTIIEFQEIVVQAADPRIFRYKEEMEELTKSFNQNAAGDLYGLLMVGDGLKLLRQKEGVIETMEPWHNKNLMDWLIMFFHIVRTICTGDGFFCCYFCKHNRILHQS